MTSAGRALMVCGTSSGAGKSLLATALARWYARAGLKVAPFKAQNMSNNARVVAGGEIGSAQYFQALAAHREPEVRMNPVLLKPESERHSQLILLGRRNDEIAAIDWRERGPRLWPVIRGCLEELQAENELVVIEGAGSPAEINLRDCDLVNMRIASEAGAATLIVADIDRGGAFAHLYGTHQLLEPAERALVRGFVLNKFRGDPALLAPGPQMLERLTGVPTLAVLPMWRGHGLPEEDGIHAPPAAARAAASARRRIAILAYPFISNLDEFAPLARVPGAELRWARDPGALAGADLVILPGSKHVAADLAWLRATGLDAAVAAHVGAGRALLAICGGLMMLGGEIADPLGVEGAAGGLGLLPYASAFARQKHTQRARYRFGPLTGAWSSLGGLEFDAYEIRHGHTTAIAGPAAQGLCEALPAGCGWQHGATLAVYVHGLFENAAVMRALFGADTPSLEDTLDGLADFVERGFGRARLESLIA
ncbi:MAG: cobyric acid synthase [Gammaproteobacteria bacterium]|nr:cobyric acid synthase [Gammaproteobacteria bacterium]